MKLQDRNNLIYSKKTLNKAQTVSSWFPAVLLCYTTASLLTSGSLGPTEADGVWWLLSPGEIQGVLPNWFFMKGPNWIEQHGGRRPGGCLKKTFTYLASVCNLCRDLTGKLSQLLDPGIGLVYVNFPWCQHCCYTDGDCTLVWEESVNGSCVWMVCVLWSPGHQSRAYFWPKQFRLSFDIKFIFFLFPSTFCCLLMCKNRKIKENILQLTDGESPSAPIGLFLEREEGWRKRRRGTRIKRLKNG